MRFIVRSEVHVSNCTEKTFKNNYDYKDLINNYTFP